MKKTYKILSAVLAAVLFSTAFTLFPSVKKEETVYAAGNITHENSAQTARSIADEGTVLLDKFIDDAVMASVKTISVIHGKGTGALRSAVQQHLKIHPAIRKFRLGTYGEGESGVTIAELA